MTLHVEGPGLDSRLRKCFSLFLPVLFLFLFLTLLLLTCWLVLIYSHCFPFFTPLRGVAINVFPVPILKHIIKYFLLSKLESYVNFNFEIWRQNKITKGTKTIIMA